MNWIVETIKTAPPEKVAEAKARLLACCDAADRAGGFMNARWRDAIEELDTRPEKLLDCNPILRDLVARALEAT